MTDDRHWREFDGVTYLFDGHSAYYTAHHWVIDAVYMAPQPVSHRLVALIREDIRMGKADQIAYIGVSTAWGLRLILEQVITSSDLVFATELPDRILCHNITLGDEGRWDIAILRSAEDSAATYDSDDRIVE